MNLHRKSAHICIAHRPHTVAVHLSYTLLHLISMSCAASKGPVRMDSDGPNPLRMCPFHRQFLSSLRPLLYLTAHIIRKNSRVLTTEGAYQRETLKQCREGYLGGVRVGVCVHVCGRRWSVSVLWIWYAYKQYATNNVLCADYKNYTFRRSRAHESPCRTTDESTRRTYKSLRRIDVPISTQFPHQLFGTRSKSLLRLHGLNSPPSLHLCRSLFCQLLLRLLKPKWPRNLQDQIDDVVV